MASGNSHNTAGKAGQKMKEPYLAYSELTLTIYIVHGTKKYDVTKQAKHFVEVIKMIEEKEKQAHEQHNDGVINGRR